MIKWDIKGAKRVDIETELYANYNGTSSDLRDAASLIFSAYMEKGGRTHPTSPSVLRRDTPLFLITL